MTAQEAILTARKLGVRLWVADATIGFACPYRAAAQFKPVLDALGEHKAEAMVLLQIQDALGKAPELLLPC